MIPAWTVVQDKQHTPSTCRLQFSRGRKQKPRQVRIDQLRPAGSSLALGCRPISARMAWGCCLPCGRRCSPRSFFPLQTRRTGTARSRLRLLQEHRAGTALSNLQFNHLASGSLCVHHIPPRPPHFFFQLLPPSPSSSPASILASPSHLHRLQLGRDWIPLTQTRQPLHQLRRPRSTHPRRVRLTGCCARPVLHAVDIHHRHTTICIRRESPVLLPICEFDTLSSI